MIDQLFPVQLQPAIHMGWTNVKLLLLRNGPNSRPTREIKLALNALVAAMQANVARLTTALGETKEHALVRLVLDMELYVFSGPNTPAPVITPNADIAVGTVQPNTAAKIQTPSLHAAVQFDAGSVAEPTTVIVTQEATIYPKNCSGPLNTRLCQYPQFYRFNVFPDPKLKKPATVAICHEKPGGPRPLLADHDRFKLAHDKPADGTRAPNSTVVDSIEILDVVYSTPPLVTCDASDTYQTASAIHIHDGFFGGLLDRGLTGVARVASAIGRVISPKDLYAIDQGGGGLVLDFSNFAVVDPKSVPDLTVDTFQSQQLEGYPGETVHIVAFRPANIGTATAGTFTTAVNLGSSPTLTPQDMRLGTFTTPGLVPGDLPAMQSLDIQIPTALSPGAYYLGVLILGDPNFPESNTANNYVSVPFTVLNPTPHYGVNALPSLGPDTASAAAINDKGLIVGQSRVPNAIGQPGNRFSAVYWNAGAISSLPGLGGFSSQVLAVNNNGEMVGTARGNVPGVTPPNQPLHAVYWSAAGALQDLGQAGGLQTIAYSINDVGDVVGTAGDQNVSGHAIRWPAHNTLIDDGTFNYGNAQYRSINNRGQILMNAAVGASYTRVFLLTAGGTPQEVPNLGSTDPNGGAIGLAVSDSGFVAGLSGTAPTATQAEQTAAYRTQVGGPPVNLGTLGGNTSQANAINVHGVIVGQSRNTVSPTHAFVWTRTGGMQALPEMSGATSSVAKGINRDGTIVGNMFFPNGRTKAVVWRLTQ